MTSWDLFRWSVIHLHRQSERYWTHITINSQLQVLRHTKCLNDRDIAKVEEPNVRQHFPGKCKTRHNTTKNVDANFNVRCGVYHRKLDVSVLGAGHKLDKTITYRYKKD